MRYLELFFAERKYSTPILHERHYVDDIAGPATFSEKTTMFYEFCIKIMSIKYTYTISNNTVAFHNMHLTIDINDISSCVHLRPTNSHNYLLFSFSHPPSSKHSIPFSEFFRIKRFFLTMMISSRSQIKLQVTFQHVYAPSVFLNNETFFFTQLTESLFLCHLHRNFA